MTARQYKSALKTLGLTPYGAAKVLGISTRQSLRYAAGAQPINRTVELLLAAYVCHGLPADDC